MQSRLFENEIKSKDFDGTLKEILLGDAEIGVSNWQRIVETLINKAIKGDRDALKLVFQYALGLPNQRIETKDITKNNAKFDAFLNDTNNKDV